MNFEWDDEKSKSNKRKHGIDFETAKSLWLDEIALRSMRLIPWRKGISLLLIMRTNYGRRFTRYAVRPSV